MKECFQKNDDPLFDRLVTSMGQVGEQSLPSLVRSLLIWHECQLANLAYLKQQHLIQQQQQQLELLGSAPVAGSSSSSSSNASKITLKAKQHLLQAKL